MDRRCDSTDSSGEHVYELRAAERPSEAVVIAVAAVTNRSPLEMKPLNETVDPDGLDRLFETTDDENSVTYAFEYCNCRITVTSTEIRVDDVSVRDN